MSYPAILYDNDSYSKETRGRSICDNKENSKKTKRTKKKEKEEGILESEQ